MPYLRSILYLGLCALSLWLSFDIWNVIINKKTKPEVLNLGIKGEGPRHETSYMDKPIYMVVEESVRYKHPAHEAGQEFAKAFPTGEGAFPIAANNHAKFVSMYHQLNCMDTFGRALTTPSQRSGWKRLQHCLNYLREMALCQADMTLEVGNFCERDFKLERQGAGHVCRDWEHVYEAVQSNWIRWRRVWDSEMRTRDAEN